MLATSRKYDAIKYKTPTGSQLNCKGWIQEAALRMLLNNLDPEVAERPDDLIVYGGRGKAARNFEALDNIIAALKILENDESLLIQSGKPVGILKTHKDASLLVVGEFWSKDKQTYLNLVDKLKLNNDEPSGVCGPSHGGVSALLVRSWSPSSP